MLICLYATATLECFFHAIGDSIGVRNTSNNQIEELIYFMLNSSSPREYRTSCQPIATLWHLHCICFCFHSYVYAMLIAYMLICYCYS